jgi:hypothetical protein
VISETTLKEETIKIDDIPAPNFDMKYTEITVPLVKYITKLVRSTFEYKEYIQILKNYLDVNRCAFYEGYSIKNGFTIEIHHSPFTLFDICETVANKHLSASNFIETFKVCEEVTRLHFEFKVGLVPLNPTAHELVHSGVLPIHPSIVLGNWKQFENEYKEYMSEELKVKYMNTIEFEATNDFTKFPKILERNELKLDVKGQNSLTGFSIDKLIVESKMKLLEQK